MNKVFFVSIYSLLFMSAASAVVSENVCGKVMTWGRHVSRLAALRCHYIGGTVDYNRDGLWGQGQHCVCNYGSGQVDYQTSGMRPLSRWYTSDTTVNSNGDEDLGIHSDCDNDTDNNEIFRPEEEGINQNDNFACWQKRIDEGNLSRSSDAYNFATEVYRSQQSPLEEPEEGWSNTAVIGASMRCLQEEIENTLAHPDRGQWTWSALDGWNGLIDNLKNPGQL